MPSLLADRVRAALAPDYLVLEEIARGGMGIVFLAQDQATGGRVAIKILRPEMASAAATSRFLREARILSSLRHPNIVTLHRAGESDGLAWYAMDYLEGRTLAGRLAEGRIPPAEARDISLQLLDAVTAVHQHGVIHRDIKPSNIFLVDQRVVLGDFGLARPIEPETDQSKSRGFRGTPPYMPPEQYAGLATERTDQCAAAMVIYEVYTGTQWSFDTERGEADWSGMPIPVKVATRRALSFRPRKRYESVADYRRALTGFTINWRRLIRRASVGAAASLALIMSIAFLWPSGARPLMVSIETLAAAPGDSALGDSISAHLRAALRNAADMSFTGRKPDIALSIQLAGRGERLNLTVTGRRADGGLVFSMPVSGPRETIADSAAVAVLLGVLRARPGSLPGDLPTSALPHSAAGISMLARAEARYARAEWGGADSAFRAVLAADSTCLICLLRLSMIKRWQRLTIDSALTRRLMTSLDSFPLHYQMIIRAGTASDRWRRLDELRERARDVDLAQFVFADEVFHRGPLAGRRRNEAIVAFQRTLQLRHDFAPAWEHLAWAATAAGDSALADSALNQFARTLAPGDLTSRALHAVNQAGFAWRFAGEQRARAITDALLEGLAAFPDLAHGARYLLTFDVPHGALHVSRRFERWSSRPDLLVPGLSAAIAANIALGRLDSAREAMRRMRSLSADAELTLGAMGYETALALFDPDDPVRQRAEVEAALGPVARDAGADADQRRRAAFMLALLARRAGDRPALNNWRRIVAARPGPLLRLLDADDAAAIAPLRAVTLSQPLLALDSAGLGGDPFARSILHLLRAEWQSRAGNALAAASSLRWHENSDFLGGTAPSAVQPVEADWALGTLARWRRAALIEDNPQAGGREEACAGWADVVRLWSGGNARYRARADSAAAKRRSLGCRAVT